MKLSLIALALAFSSVSSLKLRHTGRDSKAIAMDDVDCEVGDWGAWGECSKPCGGGQRTRSRVATTQPSEDGAACPELTETAECNTQECPVECVVSEWAPQGECSAKCGGGVQAFSRTVVSKNALGGKVCPELTKEEACNTNPCPVDCVVSNWGPFGQCSKDCGGGEKTRTRTVVTATANGGAECPALEEKAACNTDVPCPVDCAVSEWSAFGECSAKCGGGVMSRSRSVTTPAANDGAACPAPLEEKAVCNWYPCPVDCKVSEFGAWGECSAKCGGGEQVRVRTVTQKAKYRGAACPALQEKQRCNTQGCPVDCVISEWGNWSACRVSGGVSRKLRTRRIVSQAVNGGKACPNADSRELSETANC